MDSGNSSDVLPEDLSASVESFFEAAPPLQDSGLTAQKLQAFIDRNSKSLGKFTLYLVAIVFRDSD